MEATEPKVCIKKAVLLKQTSTFSKELREIYIFYLPSFSQQLQAKVFYQFSSTTESEMIGKHKFMEHEIQ